jgi:hypothetical protein
MGAEIPAKIRLQLTLRYLASGTDLILLNPFWILVKRV